MEFCNCTLSSECCKFLNSTSEIQREVYQWTILRVFLAVLLIGINIVAFGGNLLILLSVSRSKRLRGRLLNWFIVNLTIADLLVAVIVLPYNLISKLTNIWYFGKTFCKIWQICDIWFCSASILSLCAISLDRYIGVTHPLTYITIMTRRRKTILLATVWTCSFLVSITPSYFIWPHKNHLDKNWCNYNSNPGNMIAEALVGFFIPSAVILILYWKIYCVAKQQENSLARSFKASLRNEDAKDLQKHAGGSKKHSNLDKNRDKSFTNVQNENIPAVKFRRQKKAAKTLAIIIGAFFICWFPFFTFLLLSGLSIDFKGQGMLINVFVWLGYVNSALNPFIYVGTSQQFKLTLKAMLKMKVREEF